MDNTHEKDSSTTEWLGLFARLGVATVLGWSAYLKLTNLEHTANVMDAFAVIPDMLAQPFAYIFPLLEVVLAIFLLIGFKTRIVGSVSAFLMVVYGMLMSASWMQDIQINFENFHPQGGLMTTEVTSWLTNLIPYAVVLAGSAFIAYLEWTELSLDKALYKARIKKEISRQRKAYNKERASYEREINKQKEKDVKKKK